MWVMICPSVAPNTLNPLRRLSACDPPSPADSMSFQDLFRVKPLDQLVADTEHPEQQLKRALGPIQLTFLGIGAIVGAGIFSLVGTAAAGGAGHTGAGPALVLSFVLLAIACGFAALC